VEGDAVGQTLYYGAGAGAGPTASAVVADLVDLARDFALDQDHAVPGLGVSMSRMRTQAVLPIAEVHTSYYLRMTAADKPGVLSAVATICSEAGISIEALIQKQPGEGQTRVPVIILTNRVQEALLERAVTEMEALPYIDGRITRIRVEDLDG